MMGKSAQKERGEHPAGGRPPEGGGATAQEEVVRKGLAERLLLLRAPPL
jgi:hypothetical protein